MPIPGDADIINTKGAFLRETLLPDIRQRGGQR
jgi:hypothetical protein